MSAFLDYIKKHRVVCAIQTAVCVLLIVLTAVYKIPSIYMVLPFPVLTLLSWSGYPLTKWLLIVQSAGFLLAYGWMCSRMDFMAQLVEAGANYSVAGSLALVLVMLAVTYFGNKTMRTLRNRHRRLN